MGVASCVGSNTPRKSSPLGCCLMTNSKIHKCAALGITQAINSVTGCGFLCMPLYTGRLSEVAYMSIHQRWFDMVSLASSTKGLREPHGSTAIITLRMCRRSSGLTRKISVEPRWKTRVSSLRTVVKLTDELLFASRSYRLPLNCCLYYFFALFRLPLLFELFLDLLQLFCVFLKLFFLLSLDNFYRFVDRLYLDCCGCFRVFTWFACKVFLCFCLLGLCIDCSSRSSSVTLISFRSFFHFVSVWALFWLFVSATNVKFIFPGLSVCLHMFDTVTHIHTHIHTGTQPHTQ